MLIPRYSIFRLLAVTTVAAVIALVAGMGIRGTTWAMAVLIACLGLAVVALVHVALFAIVSLAAIFLRSRRSSRPSASPTTNVSLPGALVALCLLLPAAHASAATAVVMSLPNPTVKPVSGFRLVVDSTWVNAPGYRPVRVTATALAPAASDRTITVQLKLGDYSRPGHHTSVEQDIEVPAGVLTVTETLAAPQFDAWGHFGLDVWVDGDYADELSHRDDGLGYYPYYTNSSFTAQSKVLVIGTGDEELRTAATILAGASASDIVQQWNSYPPQTRPPDANLRQTLLNGSIAEAIAQAQQLLTSGPDLVTLHPSVLPTRWIDYSCLDVVVISAADLVQLEPNRPQVWEALRHWVAVGGNLWVMGAGDEWQELPAIELALRLPTTSADSAEDPAGRGWLPPRKSSTNLAEAENGPRVSEIYEDGVIERFAPPDETEPTALPRTPIELWRREYQLGEVIAFASRQPFRGNAYLPFEVGDPARMGWTARHGLVPDSGVYDFWNFLVPGVGLAPVTGFRVLISIFVIAIGPVNYFLLRRWNRLNLLLVTVPASAAIVTIVLFAYAILSDGLGTRVRLRSYTEIDQPSGTAVCWARQSYYAGLAPGDGMRFSTDTIVLPLLPSTSRNGYDTLPKSLAPRHLQWSTDQHLQRGWLSARTPTQYVTLRARKSPLQLRVMPEGDNVAVENQLGCTIHRLLLRTDSAIFAHQNLTPGERVVLQTDAALAGVREFEHILRDAQPQFPPEMGATGGSGGFFRRRYYGGSNVTATQLTSRLEIKLDDGMMVYDEEAEGPRFDSNTYMAIVDNSPEVQTGLGDAAREEGSLHVVFGRW